MIDKGMDFYGHSLAATASTGLLAVGLSRFKTSGKPMPAVPMILIGGISGAYQISKAIEWSPK